MPSRVRTIALIVAVALFLQNLDAAVIVTSLPQMGVDFATPAAKLSLGITAYILTAAIFMPLAGWLASRFGARNVFAAAIVVFTISSLACALAPNFAGFTLARAVQGLGGALMAPVGRMVVLRDTKKSDLLDAIALITWPALIAPVIGPAIGGLITETLGWRWNFALNLPLGAVGLVLAFIFIPNARDPAPQKLDLKSFIFIAVALASGVFALESLAQDPGTWHLAAALLAASAGASWLAWRGLVRSNQPLLDPMLFRLPTFAISILGAGLATRASIAATPFLMPLLFQLIFGFSPSHAGLMVLVYFAGNLTIKAITKPLLRHAGFRGLLIWNGVFSGACICLFAALSADTPTLVTAALLYVAGATRSTQFTALNSLSFADVPPSAISSASTLSSMSMQMAGCLGVAVAAVMLSFARGGRDHQIAADFQLTFLVIGAATIAFSFAFMRIDRDAGLEVTGAVSRA